MALLTVMTWNVQNLLPVGHEDGPATDEEYQAKLAALAEVVDAGDTVVVTGTGVGHHRENGRFQFAYNDLFTFRDDLIAQVDSYIVPLS